MYTTFPFFIHELMPAVIEFLRGTSLFLDKIEVKSHQINILFLLLICLELNYIISGEFITLLNFLFIVPKWKKFQF